MNAVYDEACPALDRFLQNLESLGQLRRENGRLVKTGGLQACPVLPHRLAPDTLPHTLARQLGAAPAVADAARLAARTPGLFVFRRVRDHFLALDQRQFEEDYALHYDPEYSKRPEVGRPFFLKPMRPRAGVVLVHGYMAAPMEVRALADDLYARGYAVYGVRMAGHGTSPEDLALRSWQDWYAAMNTGWAVMQTVTDRIVVSGFSTGGCVALLAAARKGPRVWAAVPVCAPLQVRQSTIRLVPSILTVNSLLKRMGTSRVVHREFVDNVPENPHINYTRNPLPGLRQLVEIMHATQEILSEVHTPALIMQGSDDPTVLPSSAQQIFEGIATKDKELTVFGRDRHGIINGEGAEDVFERMGRWLERLRAKEDDASGEDTAAAG
jgi:esterase/lipase